jgi:hypothetical protein
MDNQSLWTGNLLRVAVAWTALVALASGCDAGLEGPVPGVNAPHKNAKKPPADPPLVCRDQLTTEVVVHGEGFSPIPIDVPDAPKAALPTITLTRSEALDGADLSDPDQIVYSGNPDPKTKPTNLDLLSWQSLKQMTFVVNQNITLGEAMKGMLDEGIWDLEVENANGALSASPGALAVVDKPTVARLTPDVVCLEQGYRQIELEGRTFLRNGTEQAELAVDGVDARFEVELSDCGKVEHDGIDAEVCATASIVLGEDTIEPGFPALTVHNPETAACHSVEEVRLRVVPAPAIDRVDPPMGCVAEEAREFVLHGGDFLRIEGEEPVISIGGMDFAPTSMGGCESLGAQVSEVERCDSLTFTVAQGQLEPNLYEVTVTNPAPAGCDAAATGALRIVPPPTIIDIQPPLVCVDDSARSVIIVGEDFLVVDGTRPGVLIDGEPLAPKDVAVHGCSGLEVDRLAVSKCERLIVTIAKNGAAVGTPEVKVTNPDPAGCSDARSDLLRVAPGPEIEGARPTLVCTEDGARSITITGSGFLKVGDEVPAVVIDGTEVDSVDSLDGCVDVEVNGLDVERCNEVVVTVAQDALEEDSRPEVVLTNPDPAGCEATTLLTVPPFPTIASIEPINVCVGAVDPAFAVHLEGTGFLTTEEGPFAVTIGGVAVTPASIGGCGNLDVEGAGAGDFQACTEFDATFDLTAGLTADATMDIAVEVANTNVPGCPLAAATLINVVDPPTVTAIDILDQTDDMRVCSESSFEVNIIGTGFVVGASAKFVNDEGAEVFADDIDVLSDTAVHAVFSDGLPYDKDDPDYDLIVENAGNCASPPLVDAIEVNPTPLVFFVDPPVVYNAIAIDATVFTSGLSPSSSLDTLELIGPEPATDATALTAAAAPGKPNRIIANVPGAATLDPGEYTVRVTSTLGCAGELSGGLTVTETTNDALLTSVAPNYVSPTDPTAVTITGAGFSGGPRLYLTPAAGVGTAKALRAVEVKSSTTITAIVPGGLTAGEYYLVLVTPGGQVDVLGDDVPAAEDGITVTLGAPPVIDSVVPASLPAGSSGTLTLTGTGFDPDPGEVNVELECLVGATLVTVTGTGETVTGGGTSLTVNVNLGAGVPSDPAAGDVCIVRLTNDDGSSFDYSAFSVTNASLNLSPWSDTTSLMTGRRGLALATGRPTKVSRFLYAIGGDAGVMNAPFTRGALRTSVESANVDTFGAMGTWSFQRNDLGAVVIADAPPVAAPRTQAGVARIGRFVYLVGGHDGAAAPNAATNTLLRAVVLDPLATSEVEDLDAELGDLDQAGGTLGLGGGLYYYRVAAIFPTDDPSNPGGESLPGEALPVDLPARPEGIVLTLRWQGIAGAHGYRVYRSPAAGDDVDQVELLGEVTCGVLATDTCDCGADPTQCQLTDDGTAVTNAAETPMPEGSLGVWHSADNARCASANCALGTAREGLVTVAVKDRTEMVAATDVWYLYAIGGRDGSGSYLGTFEVATVTVTLADGTQTVDDWVAGSDTLSSPRADLGAWVMSAENSAEIRGSGSPNDVWVYIGSGRTTGNAFDRNLEAGLLGASGSLGTLQDVGSDLNGDLAGLGCGMSNDQIYTFGGQATSNGTSAELCDGVGGGCAAIPELEPGAFNALGAAATDRMFMGYTQESAFFFLVGGHDGNNTLATSEQTVQ